MNRLYSSLVVAAVVVLSAASYAAEVKSGIVKGTITLAGKPVSDAVVSIEGVPAAAGKAKLDSVRNKKAVMDQRDMKFIPAVLPIVIGTTVEFPNHDTLSHNVYSKGGAKDFDLGLYDPGKTRSQKFDKAGTDRILCNVHPNMEAFIVVKDHPFFSASDSRGNYRIDGVPLGKFRVQVWHPQWGTAEGPVEVVRDGEVLDFNMDLKKK
ncbi:MAG TPA: carboxypeptidase regulatory-like domain-containing protein [Candidatus Binatia bacterium]|jgi:plastocyanin